MVISLIVAASENNAIGAGNQLPWHLPNDMKFFKNTTWGMPVIMGRKTFQSMSGKPLPGRYNIILTQQEDHGIDQQEVIIAKTIEEALTKAGETDCKEVFVIGGGQVFDVFLPLADKIFMTRVHTVINGDVYFPEIDESVWQQTYNLDFPSGERHAFAYSFQTWEKKN